MTATATAFQTPLEIRHVPGKGRGVFAARDIAEGEILDEAHVLLVSAETRNGWKRPRSASTISTGKGTSMTTGGAARSRWG